VDEQTPLGVGKGKRLQVRETRSCVNVTKRACAAKKFH